MSQNFGLALRGVSNEYLKFGSIMLVPADKPTSSEHCYSTIIRVLIQPLSWPPHVNYGNYGKCTTKNVTFESVLFPQVTDLPHLCLYFVTTVTWIRYQYVLLFFLQDRNSFRRIVLKTAFLKRRMYEDFIESLPILKSLEVSG